MVLSYWLAAPFYRLAHGLRRLMRRTTPVVFYCGDELDLLVFAPVQKHLPPIPVVTDKSRVAEHCRRRGISVKRMPVFPDAAIMARHACHKFPSKCIVKIGMRHGPYHFKRMTDAANYNAFDLYLMTSAADVDAAREIGVTSAIAVGYPKLDAAFNGELEGRLPELHRRLGLDPNAPTILFTATWPGSGMSALPLWRDRLHELTGDANILVTTHPWTDHDNMEKLARIQGVKILDPVDVTAAVMLSDVCVGDTSSLLAECCALDKPIITWRLPVARRSLAEIDEMLERIGLRVDSFEELTRAIAECLENPAALHAERQAAATLMFDTLDGLAGQRAAEAIRSVTPGLR